VKKPVSVAHTLNLEPKGLPSFTSTYRHMTGRNGAGSTRMTRYRQAVEYVRCGLSLAYCEKHPEVALDRGWATLAGYLKNVHGVSVHEDGAPSRQVVFIVV